MNDKTKIQLYLLFFGALLFLGGTIICSYMIDPFTAKPLQLVLFYISLGGLLFCGTTLLLFMIRKKTVNIVHQKMSIAMRESLLVTIFVLGCLILASHDLLEFWTAVILAATLILFETFLLI